MSERQRHPYLAEVDPSSKSKAQDDGIKERNMKSNRDLLLDYKADRYENIIRIRKIKKASEVTRRRNKPIYCRGLQFEEQLKALQVSLEGRAQILEAMADYFKSVIAETQGWTLGVSIHGIEKRVVPKLVLCLQAPTVKLLIRPALRSLEEIASFIPASIANCANAIEALVPLLVYDDCSEVQKMTASLLGTLATDNPNACERMLNLNIVDTLILVGNMSNELLPPALFCITKLCETPSPKHEPLIVPLYRVVFNISDHDILLPALNALESLTSSSHKEAVANQTGQHLTGRLVTLLTESATFDTHAVHEPALGILANFVSQFESSFVDMVVDAKVLGVVEKIFRRNNAAMISQMCFILSCIAHGGTKFHIQAMLDTHGLVDSVIECAQGTVPGVEKLNALRVITSLCAKGTQDQVHRVVQKGVIQVLVGALKLSDFERHQERIVQVFGRIIKTGRDGGLQQEYTSQFSHYDAIVTLKQLTFDTSAIVGALDNNSDDSNAALKPVAMGNAFAFGGVPVLPFDFTSPNKKQKLGL